MAATVLTSQVSVLGPVTLKKLSICTNGQRAVRTVYTPCMADSHLYTRVSTFFICKAFDEMVYTFMGKNLHCMTKYLEVDQHVINNSPCNKPKGKWNEISLINR